MALAVMCRLSVPEDASYLRISIHANTSVALNRWSESVSLGCEWLVVLVVRRKWSSLAGCQQKAADDW